MNLFDSVSSALNRGTNVADRTARKLKLEVRLREIARERQNFAAQLGARFYDATKDDAAARVGNEALYDGIARLDEERDRICAQMDEIDAQARAEEQAAQLSRCSNCGTRLGMTDQFCRGCGRPASEVRVTGSAPVPPPAAAGAAPQQPAPEPASEPIEVVAEPIDPR